MFKSKEDFINAIHDFFDFFAVDSKLLGEIDFEKLFIVVNHDNKLILIQNEDEYLNIVFSTYIEN